MACTRINTLKALAHTSWGANSLSLKQIYKSLILSKLEYGSFLFINAKPSYLKNIETIHNLGLRLVSGAFRSSPTFSLYNITNTPPIHLIRKKSTILFYIRRTQNNLSTHRNIKDELKNIPDDLSGVIKHEKLIIPPWILNLNINVTLANLPKSNTIPKIYKSELQSLLEDYKDYSMFFTDGSKTDNGIGASVIYNENKTMIKIPSSCTIFSAEATAISHSLDIIKQNKITKSIILSDSLSTLTSIKNYHQPNDIIRKIQNQISTLELNSQSIIMIWIPSHIGIQGNELADTYARQAITSPEALQINMLTLQDSKNIINIIILNQWQHMWHSMHTKLNEIKPSISPWPATYLPRRQEVILNRLQIGHTWLTHSHLMTRTDPDQCPTCGVTLTIKHIICNCLKYRDTKDSLEIADNLGQALSPDPENVIKIIKFLKLTNLYNLI